MQDNTEIKKGAVALKISVTAPFSKKVKKKQSPDFEKSGERCKIYLWQ